MRCKHPQRLGYLYSPDAKTKNKSAHNPCPVPKLLLNWTDSIEEQAASI
jgi:hypothetical protein